MEELIARKVPTNDPVWHKHGTGKQPFDVVFYDNEGAERARFPWYYTGKPDRRYKYFTLNCNRVRIIW